MLTVVGLVLLEAHPQVGDGRVLMRTGATISLFAGVLNVLYEVMS